MRLLPCPKKFCVFYHTAIQQTHRLFINIFRPRKDYLRFINRSLIYSLVPILSNIVLLFLAPSKIPFFVTRGLSCMAISLVFACPVARLRWRHYPGVSSPDGMGQAGFVSHDTPCNRPVHQPVEQDMPCLVADEVAEAGLRRIAVVRHSRLRRGRRKGVKGGWHGVVYRGYSRLRDL